MTYTNNPYIDEISQSL